MRHAPLARRTALLLSPRGPASPQPRLQPPRPLASAPPHPRTDRLAAGMATTPEPHAAGPAAAKPPADAEAHVPPPAISRQLLSVAPMLDWTDVHYRQLARLISRRTWLYTEMVVDQTVLHTAQPDRHLWFPPEQHPVVLQLGGSKPELMAAAARIAARYGYDEINLNCGCPSDRVAGAGCFGASLMLRPEQVAACCSAMAAVVDIPITVKCRLGVDDVDSYEALCAFVAGVSAGSPVRHFVIHARKCLLKGLSPHQNRTVPPLRYDWVAALARDFPHLQFSLNGGIEGPQQVASALRELRAASGQAAGQAADGPGLDPPGGTGVLGVMVGRAAYGAPWLTLADADRAVFGAPENAATSRRQVLDEYVKYADSMLGRWDVKADGHQVPNVRALTKPLLGLFHGEPRSKQWRAAVDEALRSARSVREVLDATLHVLSEETLDAPPAPTPADAVQLGPAMAAELPPPMGVEPRSARGGCSLA